MTLLLCAVWSGISAQDLDPRSYLWVPKNTSTVLAGFSYLDGNVLTDPTLPLKNVKVTAEAISAGYVHSFNFFGMTAQAVAAVPYMWAKATGEVGGSEIEANRAGFADLRLRMSVLFLGAPAISLQDYKKAKRKTVLGFSINIQAPTGQFFPEKLINLGSNRWSIRPELAFSQPFAKRFLLDVYSGIWFFTNNNTYYPGTSTRAQDPLGTFQMHVSYNFRPTMWFAFNSTFYFGGLSTINGVAGIDRQSNFRVGGTASLPIGKLSSIKLAVSTGAVVRFGQDFTLYSLGYTTSWFRKENVK